MAVPAGRKRVGWTVSPAHMSSQDRRTIMHFRIRGLPAEQFAPFFSMSDEELAANGAVRRIADARKPGYPCRVSLSDSNPGDELIQLRAPRRGFALPDAL